jgi:hypothetical protein
MFFYIFDKGFQQLDLGYAASAGGRARRGGDGASAVNFRIFRQGGGAIT